MVYPSVFRSSPAFDVTAAKSTAREARAEAQKARTEMELLRTDVERLLLITEALWMFVKKEHGYSDEQLQEVIAQIDLRDGRLDGRVAQDPPQNCPGCGRVLARKRPFCIYCGSTVQLDPFVR